MWPKLCCLVVVALLAGCSTTSSTVRIFGEYYPRVPHLPGPGKVEGQSCGANGFLFFRFTRGPSFVEAVRDALANAGGQFNALADVTAEYDDYYFYLVGWNCVTVSGRPVQIGQRSIPAWMSRVPDVPEGTEAEQWSF